jgi:hypothetical protein
VNFTTALPDANYSVGGSCVGTSSGSAFFNYITSSGVTLATTSCRIYTQQQATRYDSDCNSVQIFR